MEIENPWGLVIIFSAFMIQVLAFGYSFAWGIYIVELLHLYQTSAWLLALIGSVNIGIFLGAGPLVSLMMRFLSYRKVALIGASLSSLGMLIMPFTPAIELLILFYGVMAGLGYCMLYIPSHVLSGLYYNKHRSLATGIATAGSGLGSIIYPVLTQYLINVYGWRGSMLILAGVNMNTFWLSGLLRPAPLQVELKESLQESIELDAKLLSDNECEPTFDAVTNGDLKNDTGTVTNKTNGCKKEDTAAFLVSDTKQKSPDQRKKSSARRKSVVYEFVSVLKSFPFIIYCLNNFLWNFGGILVVLLAPDYFTHIGFTQDQASQFMSFIGIGSFIGCAAGGAVGNLPFINRLAMYIIVNIVLGLEGFFITQTFIHSVPILSTVAGIWGFTFGLILGLLVVVTADLVGASSLGDAMGILMLANGLGCIIGPPIGGILQNHFDSQEVAFYLANTFNTVSGLLMLAIPVYNRLTKKTKREECLEAGSEPE